MAKDKAAVVARRLSGTTISATVAAGTSMPPTPNPATVPIATTKAGSVGLAADRAPPNIAAACQYGFNGFLSDLLMIVAETNKIHLASMLVERRALKKTAPAVTDIPYPRPFNPT